MARHSCQGELCMARLTMCVNSDLRSLGTCLREERNAFFFFLPLKLKASCSQNPKTKKSMYSSWSYATTISFSVFWKFTLCCAHGSEVRSAWQTFLSQPCAQQISKRKTLIVVEQLQLQYKHLLVAGLGQTVASKKGLEKLWYPPTILFPFMPEFFGKNTVV